MSVFASMALAAGLVAAAGEAAATPWERGAEVAPALPSASGPGEAAIAAAVADRLVAVERVLRNRRLEGPGGPALADDGGATGADELGHLERRLRFLSGLSSGLEGDAHRDLGARLRRAWAELGRLERGITPVAPAGLTGAGTIAGRVTKELTGGGVGGVLVEIWGAYSMQGYAWTDAGGHYVVGDLAAGTYTALTYSDRGFLDEQFDDLPCPGGMWEDCSPDSGTPIVVVDAAVTVGIDFALVPAGAVAGRVREATTGTAIGYMPLYLFDSAGAWAGTDSTDAAGRYRFERLAAGTYFVRTAGGTHRDELYDDHPCPDGCDVTAGTPVTVVPGSATTGIDFDLERLASISGTVIDAGTGLALPFIAIVVVPVGGGGSHVAHTDVAGRYSVGGLLAGSYYVTTADHWDYRDERYDNVPCPGRFGGCDPTAGTPVVVSAGGNSAGIDFALDRFGTISGVITDAATGDPLPSPFVSIYDAAGTYRGSAGWTSSYESNGLLDGTYYLVAAQYGYQPELYDDVPCPRQVCDPTTGAPIVIALNQGATGIDFELAGLGTISGTVVHAGSGVPIAGAQVEVWSSAGDIERWAYTDAAGRYLAPALEPDVYHVLVDHDEFAGELYDDLPCPGGSHGGCDPQTGGDVAVALGADTAGVDFALRRLGVVTGRVTDAHSGAPIRVWLEVWRPPSYYLGDTLTDAAGAYALTGLPPGDVFVAAARSGYDGYIGELHAGVPCLPGCAPTAGTPIPVALDTVSAGIDFELDFGPGLRGVVVAQGAWWPLPGVAIDVWDALGGHVGTTASDEGGEYRLELTPGAYYVSTDAGLGGIDELWDDVHCPLGPAHEGLCDPTRGTPVTVAMEAPATAGIDFALSVVVLFADGFEAGSADAWSAAIP